MVVNVVYLTNVYITRYYHGVIGILKTEISNPNAKKRRFGENVNHINEMYICTVMSHGRHIYANTSDIAKSTMYAYPQLDHALPHCKCVLQCCSKFPCVNLPDQ